MAAVEIMMPDLVQGVCLEVGGGAGGCEIGGPSLVGSSALWPWHHTFFYASLRSSPSPWRNVLQ